MSIELTLYLTWTQPLSLNFAAATPAMELGKVTKVTQLTTLISVCATIKSLRDQYRIK